MAQISRTMGPLHFEDLEPKRFEDLARQLVYDFKPWRRLEATGRAGSDDGFDARGYEIVDQPTEPDDDDAEPSVLGAEDRLWLVQCKRERTITPKKLVDYLDDVKLAEGERLHGMVFVAACDFSKTSHDRFRDKCKDLGVQEWHLWGKAELEDRLMQPENDGLLFAYFGVSLTIRRRSQKTELRARLVMKRKANRLLEAKGVSSVMLRAPDAASYPFEPDDFARNPLWAIRPYRGFTYDGLNICLRSYMAYLSDDGAQWDAATVYNHALPVRPGPWVAHPTDDLRERARELWDKFPEHNKAWFEVVGVVAFDDILDIDEIGDEYVDDPHVYVPFNADRGPFRRLTANVTNIIRFNPRSRAVTSSEDGRIAIFPEELRLEVPHALFSDEGGEG
jgi:hypothetical protein